MGSVFFRENINCGREPIKRLGVKTALDLMFPRLGFSSAAVFGARKSILVPHEVLPPSLAFSMEFKQIVDVINIALINSFFVSKFLLIESFTCVLHNYSTYHYTVVFLEPLCSHSDDFPSTQKLHSSVHSYFPSFLGLLQDVIFTQSR